MKALHRHLARVLTAMFAMTAAFSYTVLADTITVQAKPVKEIISARFGWNVNKTKEDAGAPQAERNICTVASKDECQPGQENTHIGGFDYPSGIGLNNDPSSRQQGDLYVIDNTHRVLVYTRDGEFVLTFGRDVNKTKIQAQATSPLPTQQEKDLCTAASNDECQPGAIGTGPGYLDEVRSIAVDPVSGDVYVAELAQEPGFAGFGARIQEFSSEGQFIAEFGQEVNMSTHGNVCTALEQAKGVICGGPTEHTYEQANAPTNEHDAFSFGKGTVLTIGGPEDLIYIGEHGRVQELQNEGAYKSEIPLQFITDLPGGEANHISVNANGAVYLTYFQSGQQEHANKIYGFDSAGKLIAQLEPTAREEDALVGIDGMQFEPSGRLAVLEVENAIAPPNALIGARGALYDLSKGDFHAISEFSDPNVVSGSSSEGLNSLAFNDEGYLFAATGAYRRGHELLVYEPAAVGELVTGEPVTCPSSSAASDVSEERNVTFTCGLQGEVNPEGVGDTEAWFEWGYTAALGQRTPGQPICGTTCGERSVTASASVEGLIPNTTMYYRLAGKDDVVHAAEELTGQTLVSRLPTAPPRIIGTPQVSFARSFWDAFFSAKLNPENASTEYFFEYGPGDALARCPKGLHAESCPDVRRTSGGRSSAYGIVDATFAASELQPANTYHYRLNAVNSNREQALDEAGGTQIPEGQFTTAAAPSLQAQTGAVSEESATGAIISGQVDPDGEPAVYKFELGIDKGASTQFAIVKSAFAGEGTGFVPESLQLSGLQPGTEYAYKIRIESSYGNVDGGVMTFKTQGLPTVLEPPIVPQQLSTPTGIGFPRPLLKCKRNKHGHRCVKAGKRKRHQRAANTRHKPRRYHSSRVGRNGT